MDRSWILLGMMGAGKSSVGRRLAELSRRPFHDTDSLLQSRFGRTISQIFKIYGEAAFRDHETSILQGLQPEACVLSTGGGVVLRPQNWHEMHRLGITIFLEVPTERLIERLAHSKKRRPLLEVEDWQDRVREILRSREALYRQADVTVAIDDHDIELSASRILRAVMAYEEEHPGSHAP